MRPWIVNWHGVQNFIQQLESTMQVDFDPTRSLLDTLPSVVRTPAFDKRQSKDAKSSQIIHTDSSCTRQSCCGKSGGHLLFVEKWRLFLVCREKRRSFLVCKKRRLFLVGNEDGTYPMSARYQEQGQKCVRRRLQLEQRRRRMQPVLVVAFESGTV